MPPGTSSPLPTARSSQAMKAKATARAGRAKAGVSPESLATGLAVSVWRAKRARPVLPSAVQTATREASRWLRLRWRQSPNQHKRAASSDLLRRRLV
eukprot:g14884.t1